jgi:cysteine desulfurase
MSVYLDWAATAIPDRDVLLASVDAALSGYANPSSVHQDGKVAALLLSGARDRCARALGVKSETLIFTSGGTESNHLPMLALLQRPVRGTIAVSAIEHPAILEQAKMLECAGWKTLVIPVTKEGFVTSEAVLSTIRDDTAFVAVMAVNNETGAIQPVREIAASLIAHCAGKKKPHFHVDAVQAAGKIKLDLTIPGLDSASISAHKLRGPRGIGLLYISHRIEPFIRGGGQESGFRPGTENLAGAHALSLCLEARSHKNFEDEARALMAQAIQKLKAINGVSIIPESRTDDDPRFSPYIAQFTNKGIPGEVLVRALSDREIYISTGSACSSKKKNRPVLQAMNVSPAMQQNAFRISIGSETTAEDIDMLANALQSLVSGL